VSHTSPINLQQKYATFTDHWSPRIIAECNGQEVRIAKVAGEFIWHTHDDADELFMVIKGQLTIHLRDQKDVTLNEGELFVVPAGVEHKPEAQDECWIMMVETADTRNTGEHQNERTIERIERI